MAASCSRAEVVQTSPDTSTDKSTSSSATQAETAPEATTTSFSASSTTLTPRDVGAIDGPIGVVGCSNTSIAVAGYTDISDRDILTEGPLTNGSLKVWGQPGPSRYDRYWGDYDERRPATGYAGTWFQMCIRDTEHEGAFDDAEKGWIEHVVSQIQLRDGSIPIWISPVNFYAPGVVCPSTGVDGPEIAAEAADWAAANIPGVLRGPDLGPVDENERNSPTDCHPNALGAAEQGSQLVEFFDGP